MKFESIASVFEYLRDGYTYSEALLDCINANNLGETALTEHFSNWLWLADGVTEDDVYLTEADKQYARELAKIEEFLCEQGFIYTDE